MNIREFITGNYIVRTQPAHGDRSYMGEKLRLNGIANGNIYLTRIEKLPRFNERFDNIRVRLDWWSEGWEYWENIEEFDEATITKEHFKIQFRQLIQLIKNNNDLEYLEELTNIISEINNE